MASKKPQVSDEGERSDEDLPQSCDLCALRLPDIKDIPNHTDSNGNTHHFCCECCLDQYLKESPQYVRRLPNISDIPNHTDSNGNTHYFCCEGSLRKTDARTLRPLGRG